MKQALRMCEDRQVAVHPSDCLSCVAGRRVANMVGVN